jgi:hypothetical protein
MIMGTVWTMGRCVVVGYTTEVNRSVMPAQGVYCVCLKMGR